MAAYLRDVENNTRDMTAQNIIKEKLNRVETEEVSVSRLFVKLKLISYSVYCTNMNNLK